MTDLMQNELTEQEEDTQKDKFLTFAIDQELYGIDIKYVSEIIGLQPITQVPQLPDYIRGIINLRGRIIPVMDVRIRFYKEPLNYDDRTCVIVINLMSLYVGLIVDFVSEVFVIPETDITPPPITVEGSSKYIKGIGTVGQEVKLLLDCKRLINMTD